MIPVVETLIDGVPAACLPLADRAIHYGDGLFETVAVRDGRPEFWERHMRRLQQGCVRLGIPAPDSGCLAGEMWRLVRHRRRAVLKIIVSRGGGGRYPRPPEEPAPTRILALHPWPEWPDTYMRDGVTVRICTTRLGRNPRLAGIKHLNRLEQVLARGEWHDRSIAEGLMLDTAGELVEGTTTNLFLVRKGRVQTPDLSQCGVAGIMREVVMEMAREQDLPCETGRFTPADLAGAEEIFLTNSLVGIWPVRRVDAEEFPAPGPITLLLQNHLEKIRSGFSP